jgi:hypothetical protein
MKAPNQMPVTHRGLQWILSGLSSLHNIGPVTVDWLIGLVVTPEISPFVNGELSGVANGEPMGKWPHDFGESRYAYPGARLG